MWASLRQSAPSPRRIMAVAGVTFTQLMRMRLFLVLGAFAVLFLGFQFIPFHGELGVEYAGVRQLELIKSMGMGCMQIFAVIFAVAATALLIPRDAEDRILYTILCKPVPRLDYLAGKALGVMGLLLAMVLLMNGLISLVLAIREASLVAHLNEVLAARGASAEQIALYIAQVGEVGLNWNFQRSIALMALGWCVLTSMTLLISCFTSGTIVSMVFALGFYFIGLFQGQVFNSLVLSVGEGVSPTVQWLSQLVQVLVPDFSLYSAADAASSGTTLSLAALGGVALISLAYMLFHLLLGTWLFSKKEF